MSLAPLFKFKHGDHCCVFYEDESAMTDLLVNFFEEGLQKNECCFWAQPPKMSRAVLAGLRSRGFDIQREIERGALVPNTLDEVYGRSKAEFHPRQLMERLELFVGRAMELGFSGSRMAGEMQFAIHNGVECNQLLDYERLVDESYPAKPVLGICQYNLRLFDADTLARVLDVHRLAMSDTAPRARHSSMAIRRGRFILDVVAQPNDARQYYYVAQEHGKRDILGWGVEPSFEAAVFEGESLLRSLQTPD